LDAHVDRHATDRRARRIFINHCKLSINH